MNPKCKICGVPALEHPRTTDHTPLFEFRTDNNKTNLNGREYKLGSFDTFVMPAFKREVTFPALDMEHKNPANEIPLVDWRVGEWPALHPPANAQYLRRVKPDEIKFVPPSTMTPRAAQAMLLAVMSAKKRNEEPTPLDLLHGLLKVPAETVLHKAGLKAEQVEKMIADGVPRGAPIDYLDIINNAKRSDGFVSCVDLADALIGFTEWSRVVRHKNCPQVRDALSRLGFTTTHLKRMIENGVDQSDGPPPPASPAVTVEDFEEV